MKRLVLLFLTLFLVLGQLFAQNSKSAEKTIRQLIESKQFKFTARSVTPMSGATINLTSSYDLVVDSSEVEAWLPFYGRAYQSDYGSTEGGIKFKEQAKAFDLKVNEKKEMVEVRIEVDTTKDTYKIYIHAGESGYASMSISSNRRQSVSYYGIIEPLGE
ncbi:DUF4251 domain-containing protein [Sunxiuqinia sp. sy24]|uniref:DUF4251 domain-containing protein n=1 Tax=Sunxiuqinia sp. sy24 TaxID=3461495 RepID=UPI004045E969